MDRTTASEDALLGEIAEYRRKIDELSRKNADLELIIEVTTEHSDDVEADLLDRVQAQVREITDSQMGMIFALAKLAESRDECTGAHLERVRRFCRILTEWLRNHTSYGSEIDDGFVLNIYHASPLHDIGKVAIKDDILLKPARLTAMECEAMKTHTVLGSETLQAVHEKYPRNAFIEMGIAIARCHHEKWNGTGYPAGLVGTEIPLCARIMAVADVYDALRSARPYKPSFSHERTVEIILKGRGDTSTPRLSRPSRLRKGSSCSSWTVSEADSGLSPPGPEQGAGKTC